MRPRTRSALATVVAIALLHGGCGSILGSKSTVSADELAALKERVLELQRQVTVHEIEIARLRSQRAEGGAPAATSRAAPPLQVSEPTPTESPEPPQRPPVTFEDEDLPAMDPEPPTATGATVSGPSLDLPREQQALYDIAQNLMRDRRFEDAGRAFQTFLELYPATELSDNASYWLGESLYARGEYSQAFEAFRQTVERYPEGNKLPDALLKVGLCLEKTGDRVGARDVLEEVVRRFPATAASATAKTTLERLP